MGSKFNGPGLYEFLIEAELQQYYNTLKNDLKVQNTSQLKYASDEDLLAIGMSRPEIRRLKKYYQKHFPTNVLAKMKKKLLSRTDNPISIASLTSSTPTSLGKYSRTVAPGRHIIQADSIVIHKTLGSGEFGTGRVSKADGHSANVQHKNYTVQQGVWTDHDGQRIQVAIKCLSQDRMSNNPVDFLKEAGIMHAVDHEHIVRLYGVVLDTSALMLVTELAPLRSLLECLKEPSMRPNLSIPTLYDFAVQICSGMEYLESKRLIHRFSKILVKISDFGLSRALGVGKDYYQTNFNVNLKLPIAWCAPECINFLRFTTSSDVFAYGVTLWELFTYGFQPWAALTGQQILEAIDEPNYQRLEKPECCPHEMYYQIMLKCWQHDAAARPTFTELSTKLLPECKPEQVQTIRESEMRGRRDYLEYGVGDVITVLEKKPTQGSDDGNGFVWKGVLKDGRSGFFNPANTITFLSFPTVKKSPFSRNDSRSSSLRKGRLSVDMISGPQGDLKHTGHVGPDGQYFGDLTFLGSKSWVPRQIVSPYKPELSGSETSSLDFSAPIARLPACSTSKTVQEISDMASTISDTAPLLSTQMSLDHEYHEISSDEENDLRRRTGREMGLSNPALSSKSQSPLDSPRFDVSKSFDLGGPSLIDEVFGALQQEQPDESHNVKNELREMARSKKKFATQMKQISSSDRKTLDHAIHLANELASRSMLDLDRPGRLSGTNNSLDDISSPRTPNSPTHRKKFSFILGGGKNDRERRNYSQEAQSIPNIQSTLSEEAKKAYNSLVDKPSLGFLTPSYENKSMSFNFPEKSSCLSKHSEFFESEPQSIPTSNHLDHETKSISHCKPSSGLVRNSKPRNLSLPDESVVASMSAVKFDQDQEVEVEEVDGNPLRLLRQNKSAGGTNVLPLPPRDRNKSTSGNNAPFPRHQRKHPLLIPSKISIAYKPTETMPPPPPPPPKPVRQHIKNQESVRDIVKQIENLAPSSSSPVIEEEQMPEKESVLSVIDCLRKSQVSENPNDKVWLYENYDCSEEAPNQEELELETQVPAAAAPVESCSSHSDRSDEIVQMKPRVPRGDSPSKSVSSKTNSIPVIHRRVASLDSSEVLDAGYIPDHDLLKIRTVRRIIGNSATEEEIRWAVNATNDAAHAVKLLRLRSLLPEHLSSADYMDQVLSGLEMCSWDIARSAAFLLHANSARSNGSNNIGQSRRSNFSSFSYNNDYSTNNNNNERIEPYNGGNQMSSYSSAEVLCNTNGDNDNIRPTRV